MQHDPGSPLLARPFALSARPGAIVPEQHRRERRPLDPKVRH